MGIGVSVFLITLGAILAFAVDVATQGVNLEMVGVILLIVGSFGLLYSLLYWNDVLPWHGRTVVRKREYRDPPPRGTIREREVERREDLV